MGSLLSEFALKHHLRLGRAGAHARLSNDQLALRVNSGDLHPGIRYVRGNITGAESKIAARDVLYRAYGMRRWPGQLSILTMPGLHWAFERELLRRRCNQKFSAYRPSNSKVMRQATRVFAIESNEAIYRAAITAMPGSEWIVRYRPDGGVSSPLVKSYRRCEFTELATDSRAWDDSHFTFDGIYDAAWLDFNGPINAAAWDALKVFWSTKLRWSLSLTWMTARQARNTSDSIKECGGWVPWIMSALPGGQLLSAINYSTGHVPMMQIVVERPLYQKVDEDFWG